MNDDRPVLDFVMAFKARSVSDDWQIDCMLLRNCLRSVLNQDDPRFRALVVCHDVPDSFEGFTNRVEFVEADFPPPRRDELRTRAGIRDKWRKLLVGLTRLREHRPRFVMLMDSDDLVSRRLVRFCADHPDADGFLLDRGYRYRLGDRFFSTENRLSRNCGTSSIVNADRFTFPAAVTDEEAASCLILANGHTGIESAMARWGFPLQPLPFRGAVYVQHPGQRSRELKRGITPVPPTRRMRPLLPRLRAEFGLSPETIAGVWGP